MNVILVNESEAKALVRSRRVLARYLPQIGSRVWAGLISEEGLFDLHQALRASASKNTSVACHVVASRTRLALKWVVGSKKHFDDNGYFAYRTVAARNTAPGWVAAQSAAEKYVLALTRLAALFHDLGKASKAFQAKLAGKGPRSEELRHDLLSTLMLMQSLGAPESDEAWLSALQAEPARACACVEGSQLLDPGSSLVGLAERYLREGTSPLLFDREQLQERFGAAPGLMSVLWLVLTHHRLPDGTNIGEQLDVHPHLNPPRATERDAEQEPAPRERPYEAPAPLADCLVKAEGEAPWENEGWKAAVKAAAQAALSALQELRAGDSLPLLNATPAQWALLNAHLLRPNLIQGDHLGSKTAANNGPLARAAARAPLANTVEESGSRNAKSKRLAGDSLTEHLLKVQRMSRRFLNLSLSPHRFGRTELPPDSIVRQTSLPERFRWQEELEHACAQAPQRPTFVTMVCETGSGKTFGGLRAANALGADSLRLTMALGLRSLTWQTAQAAVREGRMPAQDLVVAVGAPQSLGLSDLAQDLFFGSESADGAGEDVSLMQLQPSENAFSEGATPESTDAGFSDLNTAPREELLQWTQGLCTLDQAQALWGAKTLNLISTPVLACTADHLVSAVALLRGGDARLALRLTTSDLLLDEIDSYSPKDLQSVAKLALLAGLGGRHVIVMSATAGPATVAGLYGAWLEGVNLRRLLTKGEAPRVIFCSHLGSPQVHDAPAEDAFSSLWSPFTDELVGVYRDEQRSPARRKVLTTPMPEQAELPALYDSIFEQALGLHKLNCTVDPKTGKRVSVGFVRFNTARNAWRFAHHLANKRGQQGVEFKVVPYHGKMPRTHLSVLDAVLKQMCTHKPGVLPMEQCEPLRTVVDTTAEPDVVVLVSTTTLIETGRDFDFDWAVLEPRSVRGEVQAAGRVRRHRAQPWDAPNIAILERTLNASLGKGLAWGRPGVEDELGAGGFQLDVAPAGVAYTRPAEEGAPVRAGRRRSADGTRKAVGEGPVLSAEQALPLADWSAKLDASHCLLPVRDYASNRIGAWEQAFQGANLTAQLSVFQCKKDLTPSMRWYRNSLASLNSVHAQETRFRDSDTRRAAFVAPAPGTRQVRFVDPLTRKWLPADEARVHRVPSVRLLLPELHQLASKLGNQDDFNLVSCALRQGRGGPAFTVLTWCDQLGFLEGALEE